MRGIRALLLCVVSTIASSQAVADPVRVFAAASLGNMLRDLDTLWRQSGGAGVSISAAGSGVLARQILAGAPADLYLSADPRWIDVLIDEGLVKGDTGIALLSNTLVLIAPATDSTSQTEPVELDVARVTTAIGSAIADDPLARFAVGLPEAVPAGRYADEAMGFFGIREQVEARLIQTDNVRAALRLVARREAALGIVYATDANSSTDVNVLGRFPENSHSRIVYALAVLVDTQPVNQFVEWLHSDDAQGVFDAHGFPVLIERD